ncbi:class I SAM-dependent DNA methyltransferase [Oceanirhabdus sp. W0125-5]|uniref:class I SAM-dependent DNA methyltransferase n=1 Tax=Oceanirhabdus sp. W0125-5 TaxID=2999116 RepID=UPI0022F30608|nr:class I SAM-dependent methyltransferase [Oceanirhabdus sp. W0125-5]WBW96937.1 class I SAM-dependent methyltransferase [Oceanirhabdus sp. W0125-5]
MDFNIEALNWDTPKRTQRAKAVADKIIKAIEIKQSYKGMEFGCGTGLVSFNLYDKFQALTLIDTSSGMIDVVNSKIREFGITNMEAVTVDLNDGHALDEKFDVIYTSMVLHHIVDTEKILNNLFELLNENGYLCIVDIDEEDGSFHSEEKDFNGHNGFNQKELAEQMKLVGFKGVESNIIYSDVKNIRGVNKEYSLFLMKGKK